MANYYVSNSGSDANPGTSPGAAFATLNKAIGSGGGITPSGSGDTLYIAPGVYRETITQGYASSSTNPLTVQGDVTGTIFGVAAGTVDWRAWTTDTSASASPCLTASAKPYVTLKNLRIAAGTNYAVSTTSDCANWTFQDCGVLGPVANTNAINMVFSTGGAAANLTFDRCAIFNYVYNAVVVTLPTHTSEYNANVLFQNCIMQTPRFCITLAQSGANSFLATGVTIKYCTLAAGNTNLSLYPGSAITPASPIGVYNTIFLGGGIGVTANNTSQVTENGNLFACTTPRQNVSSGANSHTDWLIAPRFFGLSAGLLRPNYEPTSTSPATGFGDYSGSAPTVDFFGQTRPIPQSCGALENADSFGAAGSTYIFQVEG